MILLLTPSFVSGMNSGDDSHLVPCSCYAKLAMVSIWRLSWTECAICPSPMLAVDARYWLRAQGSVNGLHMASSCDMSSTPHSSWVPKQSVPRARIPRNSGRNGRLLMTQPWKSCGVPSTSFTGQKASRRASPDSRKENHIRARILGGMLHW